MESYMIIALVEVCYQDTGAYSEEKAQLKRGTLIRKNIGQASDHHKVLHTEKN